MQTMINLPYRFNLHSLQVRWGNPKPQEQKQKRVIQITTWPNQRFSTS
jgi:hypothetical protein